MMILGNTSVPMKVCERLVLNDLKLIVAPHLDPMQFAYQKCKFTRVAIKLIYAVPTVTYCGYIKNFTVTRM